MLEKYDANEKMFEKKMKENKFWEWKKNESAQAMMKKFQLQKNEIKKVIIFFFFHFPRSLMFHWSWWRKFIHQQKKKKISETSKAFFQLVYQS